MSGVSNITREVLITGAVEAEPEVRKLEPDPTLWPLITAVATTIAFVASIFNEWAVIWGGALIGLCVLGWFWPRKPKVHPWPQRSDRA